MDVKRTAHLHHVLVGGGHHEHTGGVRRELVHWRLEADHGRVAGVQPVEVTQGTAQVHLESHVRAVAHVVGDAQLHWLWTKHTRRRVSVGDGFRVAVHRLNHHRNVVLRTRRSSPELGDGQTVVVEDDVVVVADGRSRVAHVTASAFAEVADFGGVDAVRIAALSLRLPEEADRCARVLNTAVRRVDQLVGALRLGGRKRVPTQTVVDGSHHVAHLGITRAQFNGHRVALGADCAAVQVLRQKVSSVDVDHQRTIGFGVACRLVDVTHQRLGRRGSALEKGQHSDVLAVQHVRRDVHVCEHLVEVTHLGVHLTDGHEPKGKGQKFLHVVKNWFFVNLSQIR